MAAILSADPREKSVMIETYLGEIACARWQLGISDCTTAVAGWIKLLHGLDLLPQMPHYRTAQSARFVVQQGGGFVALAERLLDQHFKRVAEFETGDVAVVHAPRLALPVIGGVMAIRSRGLWVVKMGRGLFAQSFDVLAGWRL